jgi:hypothetical protein
MKMTKFTCVKYATVLGMLAGSAVAAPAPVPQGRGDVPGMDVSLSAVASSRSSASKDFLVGAPVGLPTGQTAADFITIAIGTTSCNVQPNNGAPTTRIPSGAGITAGSTYIMADWYRAWESGPDWDGTALGLNAGRRHPYINGAVYRINDQGRLDQLALSWTKHGWSAASGGQAAVAGAFGSDKCGLAGLACLDLSTDNQLEANCADTYGAGLNADKFWLGPRHEISARGGRFTPGWNHVGSYFDTYSSSGNNDLLVSGGTGDGARSYNPSGGTIQGWKLNLVRKDELNAANIGTNGRLLMESYYVVNGDEYKLNNVAHRVFSVTQPATAGAYTAASFNFASRQIWGPASLQWGEVKSQGTPSTDGEVYVSSRAVNLGGGQWRYEYAVFNLDLDREIDRFEVPVPSFATKSNFGVWVPRHVWPGYDTAPWTASYDAVKKAVVWTPATVVQPANPTTMVPLPMPAGTVIKPNTIRYHNMFTFWFDSNLSPTELAMSPASKMGMANPGSFTEDMSAEVRAPKHPCDVGGQGGIVGQDGMLDNNDFAAFITMFFDSNVGADIGGQGGELGADGAFDNNDFAVFVSLFFLS